MHASVKNVIARALLALLTVAASNAALAGPPGGGDASIATDLGGKRTVGQPVTFKISGGITPFRIDKVSGPNIKITEIPKSGGRTFTITGDAAGMTMLKITDKGYTSIGASVIFVK